MEMPKEKLHHDECIYFNLLAVSAYTPHSGAPSREYNIKPKSADCKQDCYSIVAHSCGVDLPPPLSHHQGKNSESLTQTE
jgi:hypothetical protein